MMPRRTSVVLVSVVAHAVLLVALVLTSILAPGLLPVPQRALAYYEARRVVLPHDIELPAAAPPRRSRSSAGPATVATALPVPLVAPAAIAPETGREGTAAPSANDLLAVETSSGDVTGVGLADVVPAPPIAPRTPLRLHSGIETPRKVVDVAPAYPDLARQAHLQGIVILEATINEAGDVVSARVLRSVGLLDQAAVDAVKRWKFTPARLNGEAVSVVMTVTVNFTLSR